MQVSQNIRLQWEDKTTLMLFNQRKTENMCWTNVKNAGKQKSDVISKFSVPVIFEASKKSTLRAFAYQGVSQDRMHCKHVTV